MSFRIIRLIAVAGLLALALLACKGNQEETQAPAGPAETPPESVLRIAFKDAIEPALYELPSGGLATWRSVAKYRPALIMFSSHPLLDPPPANKKKQISKLLRNGSAEEIVARGRNLSPNPLFFPTQAVSVAIDNRLISELILVLPDRGKAEDFNFEKLRSQLLNSGYLTEKEARALSFENSVVKGSIRGIPLRIAHPGKLPACTSPAILHVDLGYFSGLYINEVKTPSYDLLYDLAADIRKAGYKVLAATLSFSNQEIGFSLENRFLIRDLAEILRSPALLDGNTPPSWTYRSKALYLTTMYAESKAKEMTALAAESNPDDAAAQYAYALDLFELKREKEAFAALDKAVSRDKGYALAYVDLAERGFELGKSEKSIDLLKKAADSIPENPFIRIELANQLIQSGQVAEARPLLKDLLGLDWSEDTHPGLRENLKAMLVAAETDSILVQPKASSATSKDPQQPSASK